MVKSISIRQIENFEIPTNTVEILKANVPLGTITRSERNLITENGTVFHVYACTFSKDISEDISVYVQELDQYLAINQFKKMFNFNIYYSPARSLLFSEALTPVTKSFLSALRDTPDVDIDFRPHHFDFDMISNLFAQTKGVKFNSNDQGVTNKSFSGNAVDENTEAHNAIQNDDATQIIGVMDIGNTSYTLSFTQSGTLMVFNKLYNFEDKEVPMLEFAISVLSEIGYIDN